MAAKNISGKTPLHLAALHGCPAALEVLLKAGSDPNARTVIGETALHCAARSGNEDVAKVLLRHGANKALTDEDGRTPAQLCDAEPDCNMPSLAGDQ